MISVEQNPQKTGFYPTLFYRLQWNSGIPLHI